MQSKENIYVKSKSPAYEKKTIFLYSEKKENLFEKKRDPSINKA